MTLKKPSLTKIVFLAGLFLYTLFCLKEIGNFYQTGHAGFVNAEVGLSHMNTINNGFLKTKFGSTNHKFIDNRAPRKDEYYVRYPHLQNFLMAVFWKITGVSEISARLLAILITLSSILVTFFTARELGFSPLKSTLVFFALCTFPIFLHYAALCSTEIFALLPLALCYLFYVKFLKQGKFRYIWFLLITLSITCQIFWYGYVAAFVFFMDGLIVYFRKRDKIYIKICLLLGLAVVLNAALFIAHTLWMVGSINGVIAAFLWRSSLKMPITQRFTWIQFFFKSLKRVWLFNPLIAVFAAVEAVHLSAAKKFDLFDSVKSRLYLQLLVTPVLFSLVLRHLVHYHDFLVIYFAPFLALAGIDFFTRWAKSGSSMGIKKGLVSLLLVMMTAWAVTGLFFIHPEEKMIDRDTDNYELYFVCKGVHNISAPGDKILLTISRIQEPQVVFYLRRETHFLKVLEWAKGYIDSKQYSFYLVENIVQNRPLLKYLLARYQCYKYYRYFLFDLKKPGKSLRIFKRRLREPSLFFKYFVSPYYKPGRYEEIKDSRTIRNVLKQFETVPDLK